MANGGNGTRPADPTISVVVPIGSDTSTLDRQLAALADQAGEVRWELILAYNDPARAGEPPLRVPPLGRGMRPVTHVAAWERVGAAFAANQGASAAQGDILAFCDADDEVDRLWLVELRAALARADAVGGHLDEVALNGPRARWRPPLTPTSLSVFRGVRPWAISANLGVWRDVFWAVGGFPLGFPVAYDVGLSWALVEAGHTLEYAPAAIVRYRHLPTVEGLCRQYEAYGHSFTLAVAAHQGTSARITPEQVVMLGARSVPRVQEGDGGLSLAVHLRCIAFVKGAVRAIAELGRPVPEPLRVLLPAETGSS